MMRIETDVNLKPYNTFGLSAVARVMIRVGSDADLRRVMDHAEYGPMPKFVLGGGSNIVLTGDVRALVLKIEIKGRRLLCEQEDAWIIEAGAGEPWHDLVRWTIDSGWPGLENLALIPGTVGGAPIQNIGAYGVELKDRLDSLDVVDLETGREFCLTAAQCAFAYRDSIFKHALAGRSVVTRVRLRLPRPWRPVIGYPDVARGCLENGAAQPDVRQVFDRVCALRRAKLPDPQTVGNSGSFFKNPVITEQDYKALTQRFPGVPGFRLPDGTVKLPAGWLIEACGWKGRAMGRAAVYPKQALVLINCGGATADEVLTLARAIQHSVRVRFGIGLEMEPQLMGLAAQ
jgi:UDP-N-acetylmuramate dehydrogenase